MRITRWITALGTSGLFAVLSPACDSDEEGGPTLTCDGAGASVGVPLEPVCEAEFCAGGVSCSEVTEVASASELEAAASGATAGSCLALSPGAYGDVTLPAGVSLLGRWADEVTVGSVVLGGEAVMVRGITATSIEASGASNLRIEQSRVTGGSVGLRLTDGAAQIGCSEITGSADYGLLMRGGAGLELWRSYIHDVEGPGLWAECSEGCGCATPPDVRLADVTVERTRHAGVHLGGAVGEIRALTIDDTKQRPGLSGGVGLSASECSVLDVRDLSIDGAAEAGVLLQDVSGNLGAPGQEAGIIIINGKRGLWLAGDSGITLEGFEIVGAGGIGVGIDTGAQGIIIINGKVVDTAEADLPMTGGGTVKVGDGLLWKQDAEVTITGLTLEDSARAAFLIDGPVAAGSSIADVTLLGTDASFGVLQQAVMAGATAPMVGAGAPSITQDPNALFDIPASFVAPAAL